MARSTVIKNGYLSPAPSDGTESSAASGESMTSSEDNASLVSDVPPATQDDPTELLTAEYHVEELAPKYADALKQFIKEEIHPQTRSDETTKFESDCVARVTNWMKEYRTKDPQDFIGLRDKCDHWLIELQTVAEEEATDMASSNALVFVTAVPVDENNQPLWKGLWCDKIGTYNIDGWPASWMIPRPPGLSRG